MARRPRRPRRSRRKSSGVSRRWVPPTRSKRVLVRTPRRNPNGPKLVLLPVNELSVVWAKDFQSAKRQGEAQNARLAAVYQVLDAELEEEAERFRESGYDEEVLAEIISTIRQEVELSLAEGTPAPRGYKDALRSEEVRESMGRLGESAELRALTIEGGKFPSFGILGDALPELGFTLRYPIEKIVQTLIHRIGMSDATGKVVAGQRLPSWAGSKFPYPLVGGMATDEGYPAAFISMRAMGNDDSGYPLPPNDIGSQRSVQAAAGAIEMMLRKGLWDRETRDWVPGAELLFALPDPAMSKKGDLAQVGTLIQLICSYTDTHISFPEGSEEVYDQISEEMTKRTGSAPDPLLVVEQMKKVVPDVSALQIGRHPGSRATLAKLDVWERAEQMREVPNQPGVYRFRALDQMLTAKPAGLDFLGRTYKKKGKVTVACPERGREYVLRPPILAWLDMGIHALHARGDDSVFGMDVDDLTIGFYGKEPASEDAIFQNVRRLAPALGVPSYYGAPAQVRQIATFRLFGRARLSGIGTDLVGPQRRKVPPSLLQMSLDAAAGKEYKKGQRLHGGYIDALKEGLIAEDAEKLEKPRDINAFLDGAYKQAEGSGRMRALSAAIPFGNDPRNPLCGSVFTIYAVLGPLALKEMEARGPADPALRAFRPPSPEYPHGMYGVFYQSPVLTPEDIEEKLVEEKQNAPAPDPDEDGPFSVLLAFRSWLVKEARLPQLADAWQVMEAREDRTAPAPFSVVGTLLVDEAQYKKLPLYRQLVSQAERAGNLLTLWGAVPEDAFSFGEAEDFGVPKPPSYPLPSPVGRGPCGEESTNLGVLLTTLQLPRPKGASEVSDPHAMQTVYTPLGKVTPPGLIPVRTKQGAVLQLAYRLVQAAPVRTRRGDGLGGTGRNRSPDCLSVHSGGREGRVGRGVGGDQERDAPGRGHRRGEGKESPTGDH